MDVGSQIRQPAPSPLPGQVQTAKQVAVQTFLPKPEAVDAPTLTPEVQVDVNPQAEQRARLKEQLEQRRKEYVYDQQSQAMITRTVEGLSGKVVSQYPDDWQLKQLAYSRAMIEKQFVAQQDIDRAGAFSETVARTA
jgi:phosphoenolpyruvate synthase/pyruvate phosphate dikinase